MTPQLAAAIAAIKRLSDAERFPFRDALRPQLLEILALESAQHNFSRALRKN